MEITESRYKAMQRQRVKKYAGGALYVIIDELADLMTTARRQVQPLIQRLAQIGRAANIHIIAATQCPLATIIPTPIKVNFDSRVALRTRSAQDSRNIFRGEGLRTLAPIRARLLHDPGRLNPVQYPHADPGRNSHYFALLEAPAATAPAIQITRPATVGGALLLPPSGLHAAQGGYFMPRWAEIPPQARNAHRGAQTATEGSRAGRA